MFPVYTRLILLTIRKHLSFFKTTVNEKEIYRVVLQDVRISIDFGNLLKLVWACLVVVEINPAAKHLVIKGKISYLFPDFHKG